MERKGEKKLRKEEREKNGWREGQRGREKKWTKVEGRVKVRIEEDKEH